MGIDAYVKPCIKKLPGPKKLYENLESPQLAAQLDRVDPSSVMRVGIHADSIQWGYMPRWQAQGPVKS